MSAPPADGITPALAVGLPLPVSIRRRGQVHTYSRSERDPLRINPGILSPPGPVDGNGMGVDLSAFARLTNDDKIALNRVILSAVQIGYGERARILGIQQYLSMWAWTDIQGVATAPVEHEIQGARWTFSDTRTTWHLSWAPGQYLYQIEDAGVLGLPGYGGLGAWSTFYDLRFPWRESPVFDLDIPVGGPGTIVFWMEFTQTDPATRKARSPGTAGSFAPGSDDWFVASYPGGGKGQAAQYNRAAGALTIERGMTTDPGGV